ncbi:MAG: hypothetical protein K9H26_06350 [Prolixibacteraceae bacterium]|nr:hypothetical protein [Prolixibacteraceae bacterium]
MQQEGFLKNKLNQTKDMVLSRVLIVILFVMTFGITFSLLRITQTGFRINYAIQIFLAMVMVFLYVFRNRLATKTKGLIFVTSLYLLALSGILSFGLYAFGWAYFIPAAAIAFLYFNKQTAWLMSVGSLATLLIIGFLFNRGILNFNPENNNYMQSPAQWLNMIITVTLIALVITMFWNNIFGLLTNTFTHINYQQEDMKKLNKELIEARDKALESDRLKSSFLANISHEIRTPLNIIIGYSDMLAQTENTRERHEFHKVIKDNSNVMLKMVNDIVDFSKIETKNLSLNKTTFNCAEVIETVIKDLKLRIPNEVNLEVETHDLTIETDKDRFFQIAYNLADNALKFTPSGEVKIQLSQNSDKIHLKVTDSGIGIPATEHEKIFDRFYKVDQFTQGAGLGLCLGKSIANLMGGDIVMESAPGKGSVFEFFVPATNNNMAKN